VAGIVTSAAALLARDPTPSRQAIVQALDKHLCRCGAHHRMIRAVERAAATLTPSTCSPATP
jgi:nicotinate dehydrogenase subunit A